MDNPFVYLNETLARIENKLGEIDCFFHRVERESGSDIILTVKEAADFLQLSIPTIYGLISKGQLPAMKRSKRCYFSKADLINYLKEGRRSTFSEIRNSAESYMVAKKKRG